MDHFSLQDLIDYYSYNNRFGVSTIYFIRIHVYGSCFIFPIGVDSKTINQLSEIDNSQKLLHYYYKFNLNDVNQVEAMDYRKFYHWYENPEDVRFIIRPTGALQKAKNTEYNSYDVSPVSKYDKFFIRFDDQVMNAYDLFIEKRNWKNEKERLEEEKRKKEEEFISDENIDLIINNIKRNQKKRKKEKLV